MMRTSVVGLVLVLAALLTGCYEKTESKETGASGPLYRHHFVGMSQVAKGTNATKLKEVWALKASADFRQQVLDKLAGAPREFWRKQLATNAPEQKEVVRPLLDDLVANESILEIKGPSTRAEGFLAIRLPKDRVGVWNTNLWKLVQNWKPGTTEQLQVGQQKGWGFKRPDGGMAQIYFVGDWVLVGVGPDKLTLLPGYLDKAAKTGRPVPALAESNLIEMDVDFSHLRSWFPFLSMFQMPPTHIDVIGKGEYLRTEAKFKFSEKIPWKPEEWKIPTGSISEPLASFTIGQGIAPLLPDVKGLGLLGVKNYPNQFCLWSLATVHFVNFFGVPMDNALNVVQQVGPHLTNLITAYLPQPIGQVAMSTNKTEVAWGGLPAILPFVRAVQDHGTDYLIGGSFPLLKKTNTPPPAELFSQFAGRKNLMYYDWELTQQTMTHARQIWQQIDMLYQRTFLNTNAPSVQWAMSTEPLLGNTITEVTQTGPNELSLTRKSHLGFTGFEIVMLTRWMDSSLFPFNYQAPERPKRTRGQAPNPRVPMPGAPRPLGTRTNAPAVK